MTREEARRERYAFFCYHLLCNAVADRAKLTAMGYTCVLITETMCSQKFTVYFLGHKIANRPTRKERGCYGAV